MFRLGVRRFTTTVARAAETATQMEAANQYGISVSKAQGYVKGLTGGRLPPARQRMLLMASSNWEYSFNSIEPYLGCYRL